MATASTSAAASGGAQSSPQVRGDIEFRPWAAAVMVASAFLFFANLGARALWSSEFRWAEIAREMLITHNYFWPTINGQVYYDKPLGSYWLVVAATPLTGAMNETAARIPCAIAGLLAVGLLMLLVRRLYDARTGVLSGIILATSFSFVFFSRHASADVETLTGELAALLLFHRNQDRAGGWWVVGMWLVMAATSLTKGLLGFALPLLAIGAYSTVRDGWRELYAGLSRGTIAERWRWLVEHNRWFFNWYSIPAIVLGVAVYAAPFQVSSHMMGSEKGLQMVFRENVVRFFHPFDHRGPIYLYVYVIFGLMAPWSALLPAALVQTHQLRNIDEYPARSDRFALVYFWATFVFFTLSGSRRSYYILPILPAAAMLVARTLAGGESRSNIVNLLIKAGYAIVAVGIVAAVVALVLPASAILPGDLAKLPPLPEKFAFFVLWLASAASVVYAIRRLSPIRVALSMSVIAYAVLAYIYVFAMPAAEAFRGEKPFAYAALDKIGNRTDELALFKTQGPLFYLNPPAPLPEFRKKQDLVDAINTGKIHWFIARRRDLPQLDTPTTIELAEASFPWESDYNYRNKVVLVRIEQPASGAPNK